MTLGSKVGYLLHSSRISVGTLGSMGTLKVFYKELLDVTVFSFLYILGPCMSQLSWARPKRGRGGGGPLLLEQG